MKITYVCPTNHVRRPISEMARMLAEKEHKVSVAYPNSRNCSTKGWAPNKKLLSTESGKKVRKILVPSYFISSLRYNIPKLGSVMGKLKEIFKADVVHLWEYWYPISVLVMFYALFTGQRSKLIMTTDGFVGYSYKPRSPWWLTPAFKIYTQLFGRFLFMIPARLTTYGKSMLPYSRKAGVGRDKLTVLSTGIHLDKFAKVKKKDVDALRLKYSISRGEKVLLFVGMLTERKGIKTLITVAKKLIDSGKKVKVLIVGGVEENEDYRALIFSEYSGKIIFTGLRNDVPVFMRLADCLILPSEGEGLPGVVMEAMASRVGPVATREGCTPDLIDNGVNGVLVKFGDVNGYYRGVNLVLSDVNGFGSLAYEKINGFSWDLVVEKYLDFYEMLLV